MFNRFKSALLTAVGASELGLEYPTESDNEIGTDFLNANPSSEVEAQPYSRPSFLGLTDEETEVSADHRVRPIIVPRDLSCLPWCAGYAECINAGKSTWNEDQATATRGDLKLADRDMTMPYTLFSMFDGHGGYQVALTARLQLHRLIYEKLSCITGEDLLADDQENSVSARELVIGAIELAYNQMDHMVELQARNGGGGCTAITILFLNGNLYAAGAGDSRAVLVVGDKERPLTRDHTPQSESDRVRALGSLKASELLRGQFTPLEFCRRPLERNLGSQVIYREPYMTGWGYKTLSYPDLRLPLISGRGKRSRVMGTIGVTRGFGDHGLRAVSTKVPIKPFLSSQPEVKSLTLEEYELSERDCVILATDGLWDVVSDEEAANILRKTVAPDTPSLEYRLTMGAQELVQAARGRLVGRVWRGKSENPDSESNFLTMASIDDISVFVVPLYPYLCEHRQWVKTVEQDQRAAAAAAANADATAASDSAQLSANN